jgi:hypothetical protein
LKMTSKPEEGERINETIRVRDGVSSRESLRATGLEDWKNMQQTTRRL